MLENLIFLHLIPGSVIERFEFPGESENNHQTREVHQNDCKQVLQNEEGHEGWNTDLEAEDNDDDDDDDDNDDDDDDDDDDDEEEEEEEEEEAEEDLVISINNPQL